MFLSDFSIKRPIAMIVIVIALMGAGPAGAEQAARQPDPRRRAAGAGGDDPVSRRIARDGGARDRSTASRSRCRASRASTRSAPRAKEGSAQIVLIFNFDKNMIEAADEVRNAIGTVRHKLPIEMREPILTRATPAAQPIMQLALSSHRADACRDLAPGRGRCWPTASAASPACRSSTSTARCGASCRCCCTPRSCASSTISVTEVVNALRAQNTTAPVGKVRGALEDQSIRLVGRIESPSRVRADRGAAARRRTSCAWARWPRSRTALPSRPASRCATATPMSAISVIRSRDASTV